MTTPAGAETTDAHGFQAGCGECVAEVAEAESCTYCGDQCHCDADFDAYRDRSLFED